MSRPSLFCALAALFLLCSSLAAAAPLPQKKGEDVDACKLLDEWLTQYLQGQTDVSQHEKWRGKVYQPKTFVAVRRGLVPENQAHKLTYEAELRLLCTEVAKRNDAAAATVLLKVGGVGIDKNLGLELLPALVRAIAEEFGAKLTSADAVGALLAAARNDGARGRQAAALQILARSQPQAQRELFEQALGNTQPETRVAAAQALARAKLPATVSALAARLAMDPDERVAAAVTDAITATVHAAGAKVDAADLSMALDAALGAYDRHGWRYQIAACDLFEAARSPRTIPALIGTLARYHGKSEPPAGERASMMVPQRAHEVLRSLSRAVFAQERPDLWSKWWDENKATLQVSTSLEPLKVDRLVADAKATSTNSFFGIPVAGSRVVFVVDISGSMLFPLVRREQTGPSNRGEVKWDVARKELSSAIEKLSPDASFNVVFFSTGADAWKPKVVPATPANKKAFLTHLSKVNPNGGTNVWAGLGLAMGPKSADPNVRATGEVDEIFVLSDGLPSVGEIIDPDHILATVKGINDVSRIRINTVYIGGDEEREAARSAGPKWEMTGPEFMDKLATANNGKFLHK
jgi:hypothetical protein